MLKFQLSTEIVLMEKPIFLVLNTASFYYVCVPLQAENVNLFKSNIMNERIWIYTLSKELSIEQLGDFKNRCQNFVSGWTAHDVSLDASFELYQNRLLIFKVNEDKYNASGCSIDKQVRFVKELEVAFSVELLNRLLVAYETNNQVEVVKSSQIKELLATNAINTNTIVFNNTITESKQLETNWKQPLQATWLAKFLN